MWRGRLLEVLGLVLIVTAFVHNASRTTGWIDASVGCLIAFTGASLWYSMPRRALLTNMVGLVLVLAAALAPLRSHGYNMWIAACAGLVVWGVGWRIVASESGGPWRLKDRPVY